MPRRRDESLIVQSLSLKGVGEAACLLGREKTLIFYLKKKKKVIFKIMVASNSLGAPKSCLVYL